jgi:hypothetical protein
MQTYLGMQDAPKNHIPNVVGVLGVYAALGLALGLAALCLYWVMG